MERTGSGSVNSMMEEIDEENENIKETLTFFSFFASPADRYQSPPLNVLTYDRTVSSNIHKKKWKEN